MKNDFINFLIYFLINQYQTVKFNKRLDIDLNLSSGETHISNMNDDSIQLDNLSPIIQNNSNNLRMKSSKIYPNSKSIPVYAKISTNQKLQNSKNEQNTLLDQNFNDNIFEKSNLPIKQDDNQIKKSHYPQNNEVNKKSTSNIPLNSPAGNTLLIQNDILTNPLANEISKKQYKVLMAKNNINPDKSFIGHELFNKLNQDSKLNSRDLGRNLHKKYGEQDHPDPSQTSGKAVLKNKYIEEFWEKKDPSKVQISAHLIDQLGQDVNEDLSNKEASIIHTTDTYQDGTPKLVKAKKDKQICFLPIVKKLLDPNEPLDQSTGECQVDQLKLYQQIHSQINKKKIEPGWGSMDPNDQPNPLSKEPEPKNQAKNQYYAPNNQIKVNGYSMVPTVHAKNWKMAQEFAKLVQNFISAHAEDADYQNALPDELKRQTQSQSATITDPGTIEVNKGMEAVKGSESPIKPTTTNSQNEENNTWVPERAQDPPSEPNSGNGSIDNKESGSQSQPTSRFKVGIKWDKSKDRVGNVLVQQGKAKYQDGQKKLSNLNSIQYHYTKESIDDVKLEQYQ